MSEHIRSYTCAPSRTSDRQRQVGKRSIVSDKGQMKKLGEGLVQMASEHLDAPSPRKHQKSAEWGADSLTAGVYVDQRY